MQKRIKKQSIGFISEIEGREEIKFSYLKFVIPEDLVAYGFEREFIGRFPVIAVFDPLSQEELFEILSNPNNPIMLNKKRDFKSRTNKSRDFRRNTTNNKNANEEVKAGKLSGSIQQWIGVRGPELKYYTEGR